MSHRPTDVLAPDELEELTRLLAELRGLRARWEGLLARLHRARRSSVRALVRDRLLCVLHDCIAPALRDVDSIEAAAHFRAPQSDEETI